MSDRYTNICKKSKKPYITNLLYNDNQYIKYNGNLVLFSKDLKYNNIYEYKINTIKSENYNLCMKKVFNNAFKKYTLLILKYKRKIRKNFINKQNAKSFEDLNKYNKIYNKLLNKFLNIINKKEYLILSKKSINNMYYKQNLDSIIKSEKILKLQKKRIRDNIIQKNTMKKESELEDKINTKPKMIKLE